MTEQAEEKEPHLSWQELTPKQAAQAVWGGYCHVVNNKLVAFALAPMNKEQYEEYENLLKAFRADESAIEKQVPRFDSEKEVEGVIRETASWLRQKVEEDARSELSLASDHKNPVHEWFKKAHTLCSSLNFQEKEDKEKVKQALGHLEICWKNLKELANPEVKIESDVPFRVEDPGIFDFEKELVVPSSIPSLKTV